MATAPVPRPPPSDGAPTRGRLWVDHNSRRVQNSATTRPFVCDECATNWGPDGRRKLSTFGECARCYWPMASCTECRRFGDDVRVRAFVCAWCRCDAADAPVDDIKHPVQ